MISDVKSSKGLLGQKYDQILILERRQNFFLQMPDDSHAKINLVGQKVSDMRIMNHSPNFMQETSSDLEVDAKNETKRQVLANVLPVQKIPEQLRQPTESSRRQRTSRPKKK